MAQEERLISTRVGEVAITPDRVLRFPRGLIGFERHKEFTLIQLREDSPFMVLQSLTDPSFGLLVADPYSFMPEYEVVVGEADRRLLNIASMEEVGILVTVSIPQGQPDRTTLNLSGPIVVNFKDRVGLQAPQTGTNYPSHYVPGMTPNKKDHAPDPSPSDVGPDPNGSAGEGR